MLPESALCPLWGTAGQVLRADAAAAFNDMSRRYAEQHGFPLCVTDSYRNHAEQVAVRAAKPTLAAVPGTSNHGWGVALDLCGGAERYDTPLHQWLVEQRRRVRLVPARLGAGRRLQARAVALGVRRPVGRTPGRPGRTGHP